jgi:hypothetical protein
VPALTSRSIPLRDAATTAANIRDYQEAETPALNAVALAAFAQFKDQAALIALDTTPIMTVAQPMYARMISGGCATRRLSMACPTQSTPWHCEEPCSILLTALQPHTMLP